MTIYDIAQEAGVSASMVSRVINNRNGVAPEKRKRMARSLVTNNTRMVGILATDIRHEHQLTGAHSITRELAKCGYSGWICNCGGGDEERVAGIRDMARRNVQAAVLMSSTFQSRAVEKTIAKYMNDIHVLFRPRSRRSRDTWPPCRRRDAGRPSFSPCPAALKAGTMRWSGC